MLRDWRALICFGSKGEGCEEATGVGVGVRVRGVGEEVGAEAGGRVLVGLVVPEEVTVVMVAVVRRRRRRTRNRGLQNCCGFIFMSGNSCPKLFHYGSIPELQCECRKTTLSFSSTVNAGKSDAFLIHIRELHV